MTNSNPQPSFTIPGLNLTEPLRPIGDGGDPCVRLLGRMDLGDASFHVEADQVQRADEDGNPDAEGDYQTTVGPADASHFDQMAEMAAGGMFETIEIPGLPGRTYALYIYPFCK